MGRRVHTEGHDDRSTIASVRNIDQKYRNTSTPGDRSASNHSAPWPTVGSSDPDVCRPAAFTRDGQFRIRFASSKSSIHDLECIASLRNPSRTTTRLLPPDRTPLEGCPSTPLRVRLLSLTFEYGFRMTSRDGSSPICSPQAAQQLHLQCTAASCTQLQPW